MHTADVSSGFSIQILWTVNESI